MDRFCDDDWKNCPYAKEMLRGYEKEEDMVFRVGQKMRALEVENKKVNMMLTKAEARDAQKAIEIRQLKKKNEVITKKYAELKDKYDQLREMEEKAMEQLNEAANLCEARVAFLLSKRRDKRLDEEEFRAWHEKYDYMLEPEGEITEDGPKITGWKLNTRISVKEVMEDGAEGSTAEPESTGGEEACGTGETASEGK